MMRAGILPFTLLVIAAIAASEKASQKATAVNDREESEKQLEESEPLAQYILELFRRGLELGAGQPPEQLANNGLILIRGALFRRVLLHGIANATVISMWISGAL